jgi:hypothetical protein
VSNNTRGSVKVFGVDAVYPSLIWRLPTFLIFGHLHFRLMQEYNAEGFWGEKNFNAADE